LERFKPKIHRSFVRNSADAYQPIARSTTREVIKKLVQHKIRFSILTKNNAVLNDADLLKAYPDCCIVFSITTDDDGQRRKWKPHSGSIPARIEVVGELKEAGVKIWVSGESILLKSNPDLLTLFHQS
jgi:DNA repair photolyase